MNFDLIVEALGARQNGDKAVADCPVCEYRADCLMVFADAEAAYGFRLKCFGAGCAPAAVLRTVKDRGIDFSEASVGNVTMTPAERRALLFKEQRRSAERKSEQFSRACKLWEMPLLDSDPDAVKVGKDYLAGRGLQWDDALKPTLRFARVVRKQEEYDWFKISNSPSDTFFLLMAAFTDFVTDDFTGLHLTFLAPWQGKVARRTIGLKRPSAIKLSGPGTPTKLIIGEGLETCLTARQRGYGSTWMLGSAAAIGRFPLLSDIQELQVLREHDPANLKNAKLVADRYLRARRKVEYRVPKDGANDLNDAIRGVRS